MNDQEFSDLLNNYLSYHVPAFSKQIRDFLLDDEVKEIEPVTDSDDEVEEIQPVTDLDDEVKEIEPVTDSDTDQPPLRQQLEVKIDLLKQYADGAYQFQFVFLELIVRVDNHIQTMMNLLESIDNASTNRDKDNLLQICKGTILQKHQDIVKQTTQSYGRTNSGIKDLYSLCLHNDPGKGLTITYHLVVSQVQLLLSDLERYVIEYLEILDAIIHGLQRSVITIKLDISDNLEKLRRKVWIRDEDRQKHQEKDIQIHDKYKSMRDGVITYGTNCRIILEKLKPKIKNSIKLLNKMRSEFDDAPTILDDNDHHQQPHKPQILTESDFKTLAVENNSEIKKTCYIDSHLSPGSDSTSLSQLSTTPSHPSFDSDDTSEIKFEREGHSSDNECSLTLYTKYREDLLNELNEMLISEDTIKKLFIAQRYLECFDRFQQISDDICNQLVQLITDIEHLNEELTPINLVDSAGHVNSGIFGGFFSIMRPHRSKTRINIDAEKAPISNETDDVKEMLEIELKELYNIPGEIIKLQHESNERLNQIESTKGLLVSDKDDIEINLNHCDYSLSEIRSLFSSLSKAVEKLSQKLTQYKEILLPFLQKNNTENHILTLSKLKSIHEDFFRKEHSIIYFFYQRLLHNFERPEFTSRPVIDNTGHLDGEDELIFSDFDDTFAHDQYDSETEPNPPLNTDKQQSSSQRMELKVSQDCLDSRDKTLICYKSSTTLVRSQSLTSNPSSDEVNTDEASNNLRNRRSTI